MKGSKLCKGRNVRKVNLHQSKENLTNNIDEQEAQQEPAQQARDDRTLQVAAEAAGREHKADYNNDANWNRSNQPKRRPTTEFTVKKVEKKNTVNVLVGGIATEMFADSGSDVSIVPATWYRKGMGMLEETSHILKPYGAGDSSADSPPVKARFRTAITTVKGATTNSWVYVVDTQHPI